MTDEKWSATEISAALSNQVFSRGSLLVLPNTYWTGHECDLLVVTMNRRVIDVEIKISRSDFRADFKKQKWYHGFDWFHANGVRWYPGVRGPRREWPANVWKHYYVMPKAIWSDDLMEHASPSSGFITIRRHPEYGVLMLNVQRNAKPNRKADKIDPEDALDIARLSNQRMWEAIRKLRDRGYVMTGDEIALAEASTTDTGAAAGEVA